MTNNVIPMQKIIPVTAFRYSDPGNWGEGGSGQLNGVRNTAVRTPGASQSYVTIPLDALDVFTPQYGYRLKEILIPYIMDVAAPTTGLAPQLFQIDYDGVITGTGSNPVQTSLGNVTAAFQQGTNQTNSTNTSSTAQAMIITPNNPAWITESGGVPRRSYAVQASLTAAATTTLRLYAAIVRYDLMIG